VFLSNSSGLLNPVWCGNNKWINTVAAITNGIRKCNARNRVNKTSETCKGTCS
jgi:hypothetical protein